MSDQEINIKNKNNLWNPQTPCILIVKLNKNKQS